MSGNDLVFLVQQSGGPTAGKDKSIINAHVSKQTHNRRRKERALQAQRRNSLNHDPDALSTIPSADSYNAVLETLRSPSLRSSPDPASPHKIPGRRHSTHIQESSKIQIDLKAENYLRFGRDVLEPAIHCVGYRGWASLKSRRGDYTGPDLLTANETAFSEHSSDWSSNDRYNVLAFAILAYCASGVAAIYGNEQAQQDALSYAISCMKSLRKYLVHSTDVEEIPEDLVYRLFRAEVLASNYSSASAHGKLLKRIFEGKATLSQILRLDILSNALYQDGHRMFGSWTRPIFDEAWVELQYRQDWIKADSLFDDTVEQEARTISNRNVPDPRLARVFLDARRLFLQTSVMSERQQMAEPDNFYWFATRCEWLQIRLMNYYLDLEERNYDDETEQSHVNLHLCLTLATLYVLRHSKNEIRIQGKPLFGGGDNVFVRLDTRLKTLAQSMTAEDIARHSDAIAFMLFVAAMAEHYTQEAHPADSRTRFWQRKFAQFLMRNRLTTWTAVREIFRGFPYTEEELPLPHTRWFEEIMREQKPA